MMDSIADYRFFCCHCWISAHRTWVSALKILQMLSSTARKKVSSDEQGTKVSLIPLFSYLKPIADLSSIVSVQDCWPPDDGGAPSGGLGMTLTLLPI
ncbi:hypothetical protein ACLOJK_035072 [Asimina triloba]